jgi:putative acetyltransferase
VSGHHPDLRQSLVAIVEGRIAGCLMSTTAHIQGSESAGTPVIAIGPLGVRPTLQGRGVGSRLMSESLSRARSDGELGAILYGIPPSTEGSHSRMPPAGRSRPPKGDNFPAFMGLELQPNGLTSIHGRLVESAVLEVDEPAVAAFDADFPARAKLRLPGQL